LRPAARATGKGYRAAGAARKGRAGAPGSARRKGDRLRGERPCGRSEGMSARRPHSPPAADPQFAAAYMHCRRVARHAENFPVASALLPRAYRPHLAAIYAFARGADDLADEPAPRIGDHSIPTSPEARLAALDAWEAGLEGRPPPGAEPVFAALAATRRDCALSDRWLRALLAAFRHDVVAPRTPTWAALRAYAELSAAPIGRLVLEIAGRQEDNSLAAASDDLCVALQWTNFWQDLSRDRPRGRIYLPEESCSGPGGEAGALAEGVRRTARLYEQTRALPTAAGRPLALYLRAVWLGGRAVLDEVERLGPRVFRERPRLSPWRRARLFATAWRTAGAA
jgi:phytoene synthase